MRKESGPVCPARNRHDILRPSDPWQTNALDTDHMFPSVSFPLPCGNSEYIPIRQQRESRQLEIRLVETDLAVVESNVAELTLMKLNLMELTLVELTLVELTPMELVEELAEI
jgi:hypothetical protein